jgi:hypothetical protein
MVVVGARIAAVRCTCSAHPYMADPVPTPLEVQTREDTPVHLIVQSTDG